MSGVTWAAYSRVWTEWGLLLEQVGCSEGEQDFRLLVLYFVSCNLEDGVSMSGLGRKLVGLAFWFKLQGYQGFTKDFWVRQALKGYRRSRPTKDTRCPVSFELLGRLFAQLLDTCSSRYEVVLFRTAFAPWHFLGLLGLVSWLALPRSREGGWGLRRSSVARIDCPCGCANLKQIRRAGGKGY